MWLLSHKGRLAAAGETVSGPCEGGDRAKCHSPENPCVFFCVNVLKQCLTRSLSGLHCMGSAGLG